MTEFQFENAIGYVINRTALRLKAALHRAFKANGHKVTPEHWAVLNCLWEEDAQTQSGIAGRIAKDKTNLTRILDVMERNGLIERRFHESDRRSHRVCLTEKAREMKDELIAVAREVSSTATRGLSVRDQRTVIRLMNRINDNLSD